MAPTKRNRDPERDARIVGLFRAGLTQQQIADQFDITKQRVCAILKSSGVASSEGGIAVRTALRQTDDARITQIAKTVQSLEERLAQLTKAA